MIDDFYLWYCVEGVIVCHEGTDALSEVTDLDADIHQEVAACLLSHNHDFSVKTYIPFMKGTCVFVLPFRSSRVIV